MQLQQLYDLKLKDLPTFYEDLSDKTRNIVSQRLFDLIAPLRADYSTDKMTQIVHAMEDYKRNIGRHVQGDKSLITRYNGLEDTIAELCTFYEVKRKYKPYKIQP